MLGDNRRLAEGRNDAEIAKVLWREHSYILSSRAAFQCRTIGFQIAFCNGILVSKPPL